MGNIIHITPQVSAQQDKIINETVKAEEQRLLSFIKSRIADPEEAEDILQDVMYQFVEAYRLMKPIEKAVSWLFTVARNKIIDRYRKKQDLSFSEAFRKQDADENGDNLSIADLLPDLSQSPENEHMRLVILEALENAMEQLPPKQRDVFVWHELEDRSFKEISDMTGDSVNTLLSRKRYAILFLREKLRDLYEELFTY